jgi:hypothetical protein
MKTSTVHWWNDTDGKMMYLEKTCRAGSRWVNEYGALLALYLQGKLKYLEENIT